MTGGIMGEQVVCLSKRIFFAPGITAPGEIISRTRRAYENKRCSHHGQQCHGRDEGERCGFMRNKDWPRSMADPMHEVLIDKPDAAHFTA